MEGRLEQLQQQPQGPRSQTDCQSKNVLAAIRFAEISTCTLGESGVIAFQHTNAQCLVRILDSVATTNNVRRVTKESCE